VKVEHEQHLAAAGRLSRGDTDLKSANGDSGEAERHSGMIPNTIGA